MKHFENKPAMLAELKQKKFTVIDTTIFYNSELAGTWKYTEHVKQGKENTSTVAIDLIRKYQYYD